MLGEYLEGVAQRPPNDLKGLPAQDHIIHALYKGVEFLRDPHRFPDSITNITVHSFALLLEHGVILPAVSPDEGLDSLGLMTEQRRGVLVLPHDYHERVRRDPIYALGAIAHTAAAARAYQWSRSHSGNRPIGPEAAQGVIERFDACEAQALHQLARMAAEEALDITFTPKNRSLMEQYPRGATDTPPTAMYLCNPSPDMPPLTPFQIGWLGEVDYVVHTKKSWLIVAIAEMAIGGVIPHFEILEQALQAINSPLHLHASGTQIAAIPLTSRHAPQDPCYNAMNQVRKNRSRLERLSS